MMGLYTHPNMRRVAFMIIKKFYVSEKKIYKMRITWYSFTGTQWIPRSIAEKIEMYREKLAEFKRFYI